MAFPNEPLVFKPNVRFERAGACGGYNWGKPARRSNILKSLIRGAPMDSADGRALMAELAIDPGDLVAERWIVSDDREYPSTVVMPGAEEVPFNALLEQNSEALLGSSHAQSYGPYLYTIMKLIDTSPCGTRGGLSVQVHPRPDFPGLPAKPEMWRGSGHVYLGWSKDVNEATIREAACGNSLEQYLNELDLEPSSLVVVPGGTVHAIRADSFLMEWSMAPGRENLATGLPLSAASVALYDRTDGKKERRGRVNLPLALEVIRHADAYSASTRFGSEEQVLFRDERGNEVASLVRTPEVIVEKWTVASMLTPDSDGRGFPLYVETGEVELRFGSDELRLWQGDEAFVPASIERLRLVAVDGKLAEVFTWRAPLPEDRERLKRNVEHYEGRTLLSRRDRAAIAERGIRETEFEHQLAMFRRGVPPIRLQRPCILGDGIRALTPTECHELCGIWTKAQAEGRGTKFVPASGAASRMFRTLAEALVRLERESPNGELRQCGDPQVAEFLRRIEEYPFQDKLRRVLSESGHDLEALQREGDERTVLSTLIGADHLDYAHRPKALVEFHRYDSGPRTALEEHLVEAVHYLRDDDGIVRILFSTPSHAVSNFERHLDSVRQRLEGVGLRFQVTCSAQACSLDTVAVDDRNEPVRTLGGELLFRPSGHGALLNNLNDLGGDIVFIKNVDNVVPEWLQLEANAHKSVLGGLLVKLQTEIHGHLCALTSGEFDEAGIVRMLEFAEYELLAPIPSEILAGARERKAEYLRQRLDRPLRVCGMVRTDGALGGGPFWIESTTFPLQIVEQAQVDLQDSAQRGIWAASTHFNPVDIVCGIRDWRGQPYDLREFRDASALFVTDKSERGRKIKVLELPGLWNGSMAGWNTVFVEVPAVSFNPVKTVFDLLGRAHSNSCS